MEIANRIAEKSPIALRLAKEAIKLASRSNLDEGCAGKSISSRFASPVKTKTKASKRFWKSENLNLRVSES